MFSTHLCQLHPTQSPLLSSASSWAPEEEEEEEVEGVSMPLAALNQSFPTSNTAFIHCVPPCLL